jgi:AraC family transcriptional regulator
MWLQEHHIRFGRAGQLGESPTPRLALCDIALVEPASGLQVAAGTAAIFLVLAGRAEVRSLEGRFELGARRWMVLDRESAPTLRLGPGGIAVAIAFNGAALRNPAGLAAAALMPGSGPLDRRTYRLLRQALQAQDAPMTHFWMREPSLNALIERLAVCQRALLPRADSCPGRSYLRKCQVLARLQRARLFVEGHADRIVHIPELAALTNFSPWYFTKTFHRVYGDSPQSYACRVRLDRARSLLAATPYSVSEIAEACGFENQSSFARAFRRSFGRSAKEFRAAVPAVFAHA